MHQHQSANATLALSNTWHGSIDSCEQFYSAAKLRQWLKLLIVTSQIVSWLYLKLYGLLDLKASTLVVTQSSVAMSNFIH